MTQFEKKKLGKLGVLSFLSFLQIAEKSSSGHLLFPLTLALTE